MGPGVVEDVGLGVTVDVGVSEGCGVGEFGGEGVGVGIDAMSGALALGAVKNGLMFTMPRLKSYVSSYIDWSISFRLVVPHQLLTADTAFAVSIFKLYSLLSWMLLFVITYEPDGLH